MCLLGVAGTPLTMWGCCFWHTVGEKQLLPCKLQRDIAQHWVVQGASCSFKLRAAASWCNRPIHSHAPKLFFEFFAYLLVFSVIYSKAVPFQRLVCKVSAHLTRFNLCGELEVKVGWVRGRTWIAANCLTWKAAYFFRAADFWIMTYVFYFKVRRNRRKEIVSWGGVAGLSVLLQGVWGQGIQVHLYGRFRIERRKSVLNLHHNLRIA